MPRVIIPYPLRKYTQQQREVIVSGVDLAAVMMELARNYPQLESALPPQDLFYIFLNSKQVKIPVENWAGIKINDTDEIAIILPIAGG